MATRPLSLRGEEPATVARSRARPSSRWWRRRTLGRQIVATAQTLLHEGLVVGSIGNVSVRDGEHLRITPTRTDYPRLRPRDLVTVEIESGAAIGTGKASRELPLHLAVYRARPDVAAIIHTHSVAATAWSFLDEPLAPVLEDLAYYDIGAVRTAPAEAAGSKALATSASTALSTSQAVLLGHHGVLTVGDDLDAALVVARVIERQAEVAWRLRGYAGHEPHGSTDASSS